jgi:hypothetical protein
MAGGSPADPAAALLGCFAALAGVSEDPGADVLALVWGPRFDRVHALSLLARLPRADGDWANALHALGERFDALPPGAQGALRQQVLHLADNAACRASC